MVGLRQPHNWILPKLCVSMHVHVPLASSSICRFLIYSPLPTQKHCFGHYVMAIVCSSTPMYLKLTVSHSKKAASTGIKYYCESKLRIKSSLIKQNSTDGETDTVGWEQCMSAANARLRSHCQVTPLTLACSLFLLKAAKPKIHETEDWLPTPEPPGQSYHRESAQREWEWAHQALYASWLKWTTPSTQHCCSTPPSPSPPAKKSNLNLIKSLDLFSGNLGAMEHVKHCRDAVSKIPAKNVGNSIGQRNSCISK